jgi:hypothetical protein
MDAAALSGLAAGTGSVLISLVFVAVAIAATLAATAKDDD